jgi:hypothetical protein
MRYEPTHCSGNNIILIKAIKKWVEEERSKYSHPKATAFRAEQGFSDIRNSGNKISYRNKNGTVAVHLCNS